MNLIAKFIVRKQLHILLFAIRSCLKLPCIGVSFMSHYIVSCKKGSLLFLKNVSNIIAVSFNIRILGIELDV